MTLEEEEVISPYSASSADIRSTQEGCNNNRLVYVSRDFYATMESQLSVFIDDQVELVSDNDRYWWLVRELQSGQTGYVPSEIIETASEHEAKINRMRNLELTRLRSTDLPSVAPWRAAASSADREPVILSAEDPNEDKPWKGSGFLRQPGQGPHSAVGSRAHTHKKSVSFSETKPLEHVFPVEESDGSCTSTELSTELARVKIQDSPEEEEERRRGTKSGGSNRDKSGWDPLVEEMLCNEFGEPSPAPEKPQQGCISSIPSESELNYTPNWPCQSSKQQVSSLPFTTTASSSYLRASTPAPTSTTTFERERKDRKALTSLISKFWRSKRDTSEMSYGGLERQLVRVYAGNFLPVHCYKTLYVEEESTMSELAATACEKFGLESDGCDYMLTVVHYETHEILQISGNYTLGMVIELAKRATIQELELTPEMDQSLVRLTRRLRKQQERQVRKGNFAHHRPRHSSVPFTPCTTTAISLSAINSPLLESSAALGLLSYPPNAEDLRRDRKSDFITHYKFVLNRWLDGPAPTTPFYIKVQLLWNSFTPAAILCSSEKKALNQSPRKALTRPASPAGSGTGGGEVLPAFEALDSRLNCCATKMLINTSMSMAELLRASLNTLDVSAQIPGINYELYLAISPANMRDRICLSKEMVVHDILHLRPMLDPSGLVLILHPIVEGKINQTVINAS